MAIAINGSGTITGVSVGGLPDGIVDTDMLATSAVTVPKIGYSGAILQVVSAVFTGQESTTSQSYVDFSLNASITPSSTSSKILVFVNLNVNVNNNQININIARNGTDINSDADGLGFARMYQTVNTWDTISFPYLDSPSTTSSTTYRVRFKEQTGSGTASIGYNANDESYMYLLEVAG